MKSTINKITNLHGYENLDSFIPGILPLLNLVFKQSEKEFISGYLTAVQFIVIAMGQDTLGEQMMTGSGFTKKDFLDEQKSNGYESLKMNKVIREAFRNK